MSKRLDVLLAGLASEDPSVRDGWAYEELAAGIEQGRFAGDIDLIRATAVTRLRSDQVQARTFAPLILTWLVHSGDRDRGAFDAVAGWYLRETDTRGYDVHLGWLHAVAHGADYLGSCVAAGIARGPEVLEILVRRMLAGGDVWQDMENARVAAAAALALAHCDRKESTAWLAPIDDALRTLDEAASPNPESESDRPPAWLHNLFAACCTLYVALAEQPRDGETALMVPHADHARAGMAHVLSGMAPWLLAARDA